MAYVGFVSLKLFICLFLYLLSIWRLAPSGIAFYEKWRKKHDTKDLAHAVMYFIFALCFILFIGIALMNWALAWDSLLSFGYGLARFIVVFGLACFISYIFVPQTVTAFHKWQKTRESKFVSRTILFGTLSAYSFLAILILFLPSNLEF